MRALPRVLESGLLQPYLLETNRTAADIWRRTSVPYGGRDLRCPYCSSHNTRVIDTSHDSRGGVRRRRVCESCKNRFSTYERTVLATPLLVKQDGTREEFDREKLARGIRIACAKRPVPAAEVDRIVGEIESTLRAMGKSEVSSRVVGDMVIAGLKELDQVAYIRYATVYLGLEDLRAVRDEIDRLLES
ncbi:MAG TPA: transcriptional regulator NrdR [Anaerolineales bacterium]